MNSATDSLCCALVLSPCPVRPSNSAGGTLSLSHPPLPAISCSTGPSNGAGSMPTRHPTLAISPPARRVAAPCALATAQAAHMPSRHLRAMSLRCAVALRCTPTPRHLRPLGVSDTFTLPHTPSLRPRRRCSVPAAAICILRRAVCALPRRSRAPWGRFAPLAAVFRPPPLSTPPAAPSAHRSTVFMSRRRRASPPAVCSPHLAVCTPPTPSGTPLTRPVPH
ncbi:hypothetical protein DENSPDRAFT_887011 [Dentipellis sp. KUC8613]|nr:hypothetical protein DENSPDRAFT_887011 [Dentipellis sp. KUC8613]